MMYRKRYVDELLDSVLAELPAVLLDGPKGVGKTATALQRSARVMRLDVPDSASAARAFPDDSIAGDDFPLLIDEWHRVPEVWDAVKRRVDDSRLPGQFILTGSLPDGGTHSGAGRITAIRMRPMTLPERGIVEPFVLIPELLKGTEPLTTARCSLRPADYIDAIVSSGFPGLLGVSPKIQGAELDGYLSRITEVDFPEMGLRIRRPSTVESWLRAFGAAVGTTASWETIRDAASSGGVSPAKTSVYPYIDALSRLRVLDNMNAWLPGNSPLKYILSASKHYLADAGLAARLLRVTSENGLNHPATPQLFENLVAQSIRVFAGMNHVSHLRWEKGRREIDFIVESPEGGILALEAKWSANIREDDQRHLVWLKNELGDRVVQTAIIYAGERLYRTENGVLVVPLGLLG